METTFMNTENSKTSEPHKFALNLSKKIRVKKFESTCRSSKLVYLLQLKKYKKQCINNNLKIIAQLKTISLNCLKVLI